MAVKKKTESPVEISVVALKQGVVTFNLLGVRPLVYNAVSAKAQRELLMPRGRLTTADKAANLKHDPIAEYRASVYRRRAHEDGPTRLLFKAESFKAATADSALDMPGTATKAKIGRLVWVEGTYIDIYGVPELYMAVVRNSDPGRTPDIRTRAIVPEWCAQITVSYMMPQLTAETVGNLVAAGGFINGIGDGRPQKGKLNFGQFTMCGADDPTFQRIMREGGMAAQDAALNAELPACYDQETEDLLAWFVEERAKRGRNEVEAKKPARRKAGAEEVPATLN